MELEGVIIKMRGIACILKYMGYVEDDVKDKEYAMDFFSAELFEGFPYTSFLKISL